jgi:hypothetical protein
MNPSFRGGSIIVCYPSKIGATHQASNNHNYIVGEDRLAHIRTIVVSYGGKLTYLLIYLYDFVPVKACGDFWSVGLIFLLMSLVCCLWL